MASPNYLIVWKPRCGTVRDRCCHDDVNSLPPVKSHIFKPPSDCCNFRNFLLLNPQWATDSASVSLIFLEHSRYKLYFLLLVLVLWPSEPLQMRRSVWAVFPKFLLKHYLPMGPSDKLIFNVKLLLTALSPPTPDVFWLLSLEPATIQASLEAVNPICKQQRAWTVEPACNTGDVDLIPGQEESFWEGGMATHPLFLPWESCWQEPGRLWSLKSQRVGYDSSD